MKNESKATPDGIARVLLNNLRRHARICTLALPLTLAAAPLAVAAEPATAEKAAAEEAAPEVKHVDWTSDVDAAMAQAQKEGKDLLFFFTGSDWCAFCIKLEKDVLTQPGAAKRLEERYVPVVLDFPHSKPQSDEVKKRNDELKKQLSVRGFPSLVFVDANLMPQGQIVGYRAPEAFWQSFDSLVSVSEKLASAKDGKQVDDITDYKQLDQLLQAVPEDVMKSGWMETMRRTVEASRGKDEAIANKWSEKLAKFEQEIAELKFSSEFLAGLMKIKEEAKSPDQVIAFFDESVKANAEFPQRVVMIKFMKMRYLMEVKKYDEALVIADDILATEGAGEREKRTTVAIKRQITRFLEQGEPAEGSVPATRMIRPGT